METLALELAQGDSLLSSEECACWAHWVRLQPGAPGEAGGWHSPGLHGTVPPQSGSGHHAS